MKLLQNRSTGEIGCLVCSFGKTPEKITVVQYIDGKRGSKVWYYGSLAELNEEWEDYEEPEGWWFIDRAYEPHATNSTLRNLDADREIGNYFGTKEEAERAVRKLKAWKRLKDKGFRFEGWQDLEACDETERLVVNRIVDGENIIGFRMDDYHECIKDLNICFGGEE